MNTQAGVPLLQLSCREASRLASDALDRELTRRERFALRIHTWLCRSCRAFASQILVLRQAIAKMPDSWRKPWLDEPTRLSAERRDSIKRLLAEAGKTNSRE